VTALDLWPALVLIAATPLAGIAAGIVIDALLQLRDLRRQAAATPDRRA
jgi:hypothetical protein